MGDLNFVPGKRRAGLRAENLGYSLHRSIKPINQPREPTPDSEIYGPPQSASDDETGSQDDALSDDNTSPLRKAEKITEKSKIAVLGSADTNSSTQNELYVNPSNIGAGNFSFGESAKNASSLFPSPKRRPVVTRTSSEEDITSPFNVQPKRQKTSWGKRKSIANIHKSRSSAKSTKSPRKSSVSTIENGNAKKGFRQPETESLLLQVDQINQSSSDKKTFKAPPKPEYSPRSLRTPNRPSKDNRDKPTDESQQKIRSPTVTHSPKTGKKKNNMTQKFLMPTVISRNPENIPLKIPFKKPGFVTNAGMAGVNEVDNLMGPNKAKLPDSSLVLPSSMTASSLRSTSNDDSSPLSSPMSSPLSSPDIDALMQDLPIHTSKPLILPDPTIETKCPVCGELVQRAFLEEFDCGTKPLTIRQQTQFCKAHNSRSAMNEWKNKGYPIIDWLHLNERLASFHDSIDNILKGKQRSYYRDSFENQLKNRQSRIIKNSLEKGSGMEDLEPGYYGSRGARIMMENITSHFAPQLRRLAASDKLVSSRGVSGYVQAVLVPELATMLVCEDMGVDEEGARAIIRDSIKMGRLLCEEEDEIIKDRGEQEDSLVD